MREVSNAIEARAGTLLEFIGDEAADGGTEIVPSTDYFNRVRCAQFDHAQHILCHGWFNHMLVGRKQ